MKDKYIKPLRLANKLFYWIPEMINHPLQKYVADPSMARSSNKKENNRIKINAPEWVVSDYASESDIVERFVTLTSIIIQQPEVILCQ